MSANGWLSVFVSICDEPATSKNGWTILVSFIYLSGSSTSLNGQWRPLVAGRLLLLLTCATKKTKQECDKESRQRGLNSLLNLFMFFFFRTVCHLWLVLQSVKKEEGKK